MRAAQRKSLRLPEAPRYHPLKLRIPSTRTRRTPWSLPLLIGLRLWNQIRRPTLLPLLLVTQADSNKLIHQVEFWTIPLVPTELIRHPMLLLLPSKPTISCRTRFRPTRTARALPDQNCKECTPLKGQLAIAPFSIPQAMEPPPVVLQSAPRVLSQL